MGFIKYMSLGLASPQSGLQPVWLMNISHMDAGNTPSSMFLIILKIMSAEASVLMQRNEVQSSVWVSPGPAECARGWAAHL